MQRMSDETVRGRIRNYLTDKLPLFVEPILEVGSLLPYTNEGPAEWANNRTLLPPGADWTGLDCQEGPNVDVVGDVEQRLILLREPYNTVLCSEVMEHLYKPWDALKNMHHVLAPGGWLIITTLFSFPIHGYPDDYWRYTPNCMRRLLEDAGFRNIEVTTAGTVGYDLANTDPAYSEHKEAPMHIFAVAQK